MNKAIEWGQADWNLSDKEIAARLGCRVATVKTRRMQLESKEGCRKSDFSKTAPPTTIRLEPALYNALEFFGVLAGGFEKVVPVADIIRAVLIQLFGRLKKTYPEDQESLERFLASETVAEARSIFARLEQQVEALEEEQAKIGNSMRLGIEIEERLRAIGIDWKHRDAFRDLARLKRACNIRPYTFHLQAMPAKGDGRVTVTVYAPAKDWNSRRELVFESEDGKPLVLGVDLAEDEEDILHGLPKEASPRELFHKIFQDWTSVDALRPRVDDLRIREADCEPEAYRLYRQLKEQQ